MMSNLTKEVVQAFAEAIKEKEIAQFRAQQEMDEAWLDYQNACKEASEDPVSKKAVKQAAAAIVKGKTLDLARDIDQLQTVLAAMEVQP